MRYAVTDEELSAAAENPQNRVTRAQVEAAIKRTEFVVRDTLTICVLEMENGFQVEGTSVCLDPANYNQKIGEVIARSKAVEKIWPLLGYELRTRLTNYTPIPTSISTHAETQGDFWPEDKAEPQASAASPARAEKSTGDTDDIIGNAIIAIAKTCHEATRAYCETNGDFSHKSWDDVPDWQQDIVIRYVLFILDNPTDTARDLHQKWVEDLEAQGWAWGKTIDPANKLHPDLLDHDLLPIEQRTKDNVLRAIVGTLSGKMRTSCKKTSPSNPPLTKSSEPSGPSDGW